MINKRLDEDKIQFLYILSIQVLNLIKNKKFAEHIRKNKISLTKTHDPSYYGGFWGKDDFGTSHTSVLAKNGDAVSATATVNT